MTTSSSPIVFIVDDEEDMRLAMQRILKTVNLRAELFATAQDFLERQIPDVPSCLVLDVRLPGMGGLEVQQKLIEAGNQYPHYLHHCPRGYSHDGKGHEVGCLLSS
jgi:FixJ family two-component response regulator